ncbi:MAG: pentapeptide repeat-containing protein [Pseudomonadota bacterium]
MKIYVVGIFLFAIALDLVAQELSDGRRISVPGVEISDGEIRIGGRAVKIGRGGISIGDGTVQLERGMDASGQRFVREDFGSEDLSGSDFAGATFQTLDFRGTQLRGANFSNARFANVDFVGADLSEVNFTGAEFSGVDFNNVDLSNACFHNAKMGNVDLIASVLTGAHFGGSRRANVEYHGTPRDDARWESTCELPIRSEVTGADDIVVALEESGEVDLTVGFQLDSDQLFGAAHAQLLEISTALMREELALDRYIIEGHTDSSGDASYNQDLSFRRAVRIKRVLMREYAIDGHRLDVIGFGEERPIASNSSDAGRALNRRVTLRRSR